MKNTIWLLCFLLPCLYACTKEADHAVAVRPVYEPEKNAYRAVEISGTNAHWGDFRLKIFYSYEKIDSMKRYNSRNKLTGRVSVRLNSKTNQEYKFYDYIPAIDADSVQRLDEWLAGKYGRGNYSLEDSIPITGCILRNYKIILDEYGRLGQQTIEIYQPFEDQGTGDDFKKKYPLAQRVISRYEYNEDHKIVAERIFQDVYDLEDEEKVVRRLLKNEIVYEGERIIQLVGYEAPEGKSFTETDRYQYHYSDGLLTAVTGQGYDRQISYSGGNISKIICNGIQTAYEFDDHGNVIGIDDGQGNRMHIKYEAGNGNFSDLISLFEKAIGTPYIK